MPSFACGCPDGYVSFLIDVSVIDKRNVLSNHTPTIPLSKAAGNEQKSNNLWKLCLLDNDTFSDIQLNLSFRLYSTIVVSIPPQSLSMPREDNHSIIYRIHCWAMLIVDRYYRDLSQSINKNIRSLIALSADPRDIITYHTDWEIEISIEVRIFDNREEVTQSKPNQLKW